MSILLSTAYWPSQEYFFYLLNSDKVEIEKCENYQRQSYRNRTKILTTNGPLELSIPVKKGESEKITAIEISYSEKWQSIHWGAITSAYKNSPYFEFFEEKVSVFYKNEFEDLFSFNQEQIKCVLNILRIKKEISFTNEFQKIVEGKADLREMIHPKKEISDEKIREKLKSPYRQVFAEKFAFVPNLSILDLLFCKGLGTIDYLK
jgi:hypothetical protein